MPLICFIKGNFCLFVVSNAVFPPGLSSGKFLYCETLNVRGLNSSRKLHIKKYSIVFLQETYSSTDQDKIWSNDWGSKVYFCHGSKHSKGVAILFNS